MNYTRCPLLGFLLSLTLLAAPAGKAATAWQALDTLKAERGAGALRSVTQVRGHRGQDQPKEWEVVTRLADGERVYVLEGGRIVADTIYSSAAGVTVDVRRLRVDSAEVFTISNRKATDAKVGFNAIDYELRAAAHGNAPLWVVHLRDSEGKDVGRLEISGEDGKLVKEEWFAARKSEREPIGPEPSPDRKAVRTYQPAPEADPSNPEIGRAHV